MKKDNIDEDDFEEIRSEISQIKNEKINEKPPKENETNKLISKSKKDIENFLSFGSFIEYDSFVNSLSFLSTKEKLKNYSLDSFSLLNKEKELSSEENFNENFSKTKNSFKKFSE